MSARGIAVQVLDGAVVIAEGVSQTLTPDGDLVVLDADGAEVARFGVTEWINARVIGPQFGD